MISKVIVRTVLVSITALILWAIWLTWSFKTNNVDHVIARKAILILMESGVLLAALSLLIESFLSFGNIVVSRNSLMYFLSGATFFDVDADADKKPIASVRTCELFAFRSLVLASLGFFIVACTSVLYELVRNIILLLRNQYVSTVSWAEISTTVITVVVGLLIGVPTAMLVIKGHELIRNKVQHKHPAIRVTVLYLYFTLALGIMFGILKIMLFKNDIAFIGMPYYLIMLEIIGITFCLAIGLLIIVAIGYGLYRLAGKTINRFPILGAAWNQICPLQTVHFKE